MRRGRPTGIILAAVITALLGLPMAIDLIIEYLAGFFLRAFYFSVAIYEGNDGWNVLGKRRRTFLPEFISMNTMMAGMAPVMAFLMMGADMRAMDPKTLLFWVSCAWA